jgi:hypothetical protein
MNGIVSANYETWSLSTGYTQNIGPGGGLTTTPTLNQTVFTSASKRFAKDWTAFLQAAYSKNVSISGNDIDISTYTAGGGVTVLLWRGLNASLNYNRIDQHSAGRLGVTTDRNQLMFTLTASAPPWRMVD